MRRHKNEHGLTPQQERFCYYVACAFAPEDEVELTYIAAYRKAYNCKSDAKKQTHSTEAYRLIKENPYITPRIDEYKRQLSELVDMRMEEIVDYLVRMLNWDPLNHKITDPITGKLRWRQLEEYPKHWRRLLKAIHFPNGGTRYVVDKELALKVLLKIKCPTTHNVNIQQSEDFEGFSFGFPPAEG